jgi:hypothetical protein
MPFAINGFAVHFQSMREELSHVWNEKRVNDNLVFNDREGFVKHLSGGILL